METLPSPAARLGIRLGIGAAILVVAAWLFGAVAEDVVTGDRITLVDAALAEWLHGHATPSVTRWVLLVTNLHSTFAVAAYAVAAGLWLAWRRRWHRLLTLAVCVGGGLALNVAMKLAFQRARPRFDDPLLTLSSYSFPSGHVLASTLFYGLCVAWVFGRTRRPGPRLLAAFGALAAIAFVGFTRMYLGVHYLTDVVAAFLEGVAWLALCLTAMDCVPAARTPGPDRRAWGRLMSAAGRRRITVLLNAGSGTGHGAGLADTVRGLLGGGDAEVEVREIAPGASVDGAIAAAKAERPDVLVAAGGDGTLTAVAAALVDTEIVLGVLPLGTLNHFAKDLGIPLELEGAAGTIVAGRTTRIDVGEVNGRVFVNNSSIGLYPEIVADRERQQRRLGRGKWPALAWASWAALRRYPFLDVTLRIDGTEHFAQDAVRLHRQ